MTELPITIDAAATAAAFIKKWQGVTASELSTSQSFLIDLCHLLAVPTPHPTAEQDYMFERPISFSHGDGSSSAGRIDLYRRGAFVLESKKLRAASHTQGFDKGMLSARSQAENYARALPAAEGRPPFVLVVDVGNRIEIYAEFSRSGGTYTPFPDPRSHRIALADLAQAEVRERLQRIWTDPLSLDPARESARVTRAIADQLAQTATSWRCWPRPRARTGASSSRRSSAPCSNARSFPANGTASAPLVSDGAARPGQPNIFGRSVRAFARLKSRLNRAAVH